MTFYLFTPEVKMIFSTFFPKASQNKKKSTKIILLTVSEIRIFVYIVEKLQTLVNERMRCKFVNEKECVHSIYINVGS